MQMKPLFIAIFLTILCNVCHSQNEFSNIALNKGFIFNVDNETIISTGEKYKSGQFAISDADGNLQIFGDASRIYDGDGVLLYKCDIEHGRSSISWVVADSKNKNQFYVFNSYEKIGAPAMYQYYTVISHYFVINIDEGTYVIDEKIVNMYGDSLYYDSFFDTSCVLTHPDGDKIWFVIRNGMESFTSYLIYEGNVVKKMSSIIQITGRTDSDSKLPLKTNPRQTAIFLPNGCILDFNNRTGELKENNKFKIPEEVTSFEFSQSGEYLFGTKRNDDFLTISRYYVSQLEQGITDNEDILYKEKLEMSGRTTLRGWMNLFRHPNSSIYFFCYNNYISKVDAPDSSTPVFVPKAIKLPSKLASAIPFHHCLILSPIIPCTAPPAPRIIPE